MSEPDFFPQSQSLTLRQVAEMARVPVPDACDGDTPITAVAPVESAGAGDLAYMDNPAYADWPDLALSDIKLIGRVIWTGRRVA